LGYRLHNRTAGVKLVLLSKLAFATLPVVSYQDPPHGASVEGFVSNLTHTDAEFQMRVRTGTQCYIELSVTVSASGGDHTGARTYHPPGPKKTQWSHFTVIGYGWDTVAIDRVAAATSYALKLRCALALARLQCKAQNASLS